MKQTPIKLFGSSLPSIIASIQERMALKDPEEIT